MGTPSRRDDMPLQQQVNLQAFDKEEIYFFRLINPLEKKTGVLYIIIVTNYLTRWVEAQLVKYCRAETATHFIF